MADLLRRTIWYAMCGCLFVFVLLVSVGQAVESHVQSTRVIILRDELTAGVHRISGIVPVSVSCAELSVRAEQVSGKTYRLLFETWQNPSLHCTKEETPRWIKTVVFTEDEPASFVATMDGEYLPISIEPYALRRASSTPGTEKP
ncbi:hypothetical protein FJY94_03805 [Candidatus Kaiserbacteria bacterium]|nr:hypothetical protein [Candidatus Kaiserbacteria bacterium]